MVMTDPIADMLSRIRNSQKAQQRRVEMPASNLKIGIARLLADHQFIEKFQVIEDGKQNILRLNLRYNHDGEPAIKGLKRVSTPGRRVYAGVTNLPRVREGLGMAILSTSKGVLSDHEARRLKAGGEILAYVW